MAYNETDDILNRVRNISQGMGYSEGGTLKAVADEAAKIGSRERMFREEMSFKKAMMNKQYKIKEQEAEKANFMTLLGFVANLISPTSAAGEKLWGKTTQPTTADIVKAQMLYGKQGGIVGDAGGQTVNQLELEKLLSPKSESGLLTQDWGWGGQGGGANWLKWLLGLGGGLGVYNKLKEPIDYGNDF